MSSIVEEDQYSFCVKYLVNECHVLMIHWKINNYYCFDIYFSKLTILQNGNHSSNQSSFILFLSFQLIK